MFGVEPNIISFAILMFVTVTSTVAYLPQAVRLIKTKSSKDLSLTSWSVWLTQYILMSIYAVVFTVDIILCLGYFVEAGFCVFIIVLALRCRRKEKS